MTNQLGTISYGVFTTLVTEAANRALKAQKRRSRCGKYDDLLL